MQHDKHATSLPAGIPNSLQIVLKNSMFGTAGFDPLAVENTWIDVGPTLRTSRPQNGNENCESKADFRVPHWGAPVAENSVRHHEYDRVTSKRRLARRYRMRLHFGKTELLTPVD
ncbi:MAG: hypothetical protein ACI8P0_005436 [Planctomycetaceae bacterium]